MMPNTAPLASLVSFSPSSAFASAISSSISVCSFSRTSSTARPRSETGGGSVDKAPQHPREDERARERRADQHLGTLGQRSLGGSGLGRRRLPPRSVGGGRGGRRRLAAHARRCDARARHRGHGLRRTGLGLGPRRVGRLASSLGLLRGTLGLLALAPRAARELLLFLGRLGDLLLGLCDLFFALARLGGLDVALDLGCARLALGDRARFAHSGGSSPKRRTQIRVAILVVTTVASAPRPASRPDHMRRLTISLSVMWAGV